jgi:O-antigen/teichoic acid export membrane protein
LRSLQIWIARGSILSLAPIVEYGSRFLRTAVLSRLLLPDEFGISVAIATVLSIAGLVTDLSLDKFVVVNTSQDKSQTLAAVHVLSIARGLLLSSILLAVASSTAKIFGIPQFTGSFAIAALYPIMSSFAHLGIKQVQQQYQFVPETIAQIITQISAVAAAIVAAYFLRDHRAILASFFTEAVVYTIASQMLARTNYRLWPDRATLRAASNFGLPLVINGIGLAALSQFDRMLIGSWLGVQTLGAYAVILSLSTFPMNLIFRIFYPIAAAILLESKNTPLHETRPVLLLFISEAVAVLYALSVALTLDWLTPIIFGPSFQVAQGVQLLLVVIVFLRVLRGSAPTMFLLVAGRTRELALLNLVSGIGILCAFWLLHYSLSLEAALFGQLIGDVLASVLMLYLSSMRALPNRHLLRTDGTMSLISLAIIVGTLVWNPQPTWEARGIVFLGGLIGVAAQFAVGFYNHRGFGLTRVGTH